MNNKDWNSVLIPMIRKMMPTLIAQEIVGVQPMTMPKHLPKFMVVDQTVDKLPAPPEGHLTVDVDFEVSRWIQEQPIYMWKFGDVPAYSGARDRFTISKQLYSWMALKWS